VRRRNARVRLRNAIVRLRSTRTSRVRARVSLTGWRFSLRNAGMARRRRADGVEERDRQLEDCVSEVEERGAEPRPREGAL
jgi:hypothetical protein